MDEMVNINMKGVVGQHYWPQKIEINVHFWKNNCAYVLRFKLLI
jgi:hypothetical protein